MFGSFCWSLFDIWIIFRVGSCGCPAIVAITCQVPPEDRLRCLLQTADAVAEVRRTLKTSPSQLLCLLRGAYNYPPDWRVQSSDGVRRAQRRPDRDVSVPRSPFLPWAAGLHGGQGPRTAREPLKWKRSIFDSFPFNHEAVSFFSTFRRPQTLD